ncbi:MAG: hypothetical protein MZU95_08665 [Desulfomicrobium escambiense]|nr:hypothetical protein [Desulfomicrobium escambiense]
MTDWEEYALWARDAPDSTPDHERRFPGAGRNGLPGARSPSSSAGP